MAYGRKSVRHKRWSYCWEAVYFVTICTKNKQNYFGSFTDGKFVLSNVGFIADVLWHEIKNHAKDVQLGEYVVMPNHIHGIVKICRPGSDQDKACLVPTDTNVQQKMDISPDISHFRFQNQGKNTISAIVGSYKSAVKKHCNRLGIEFSWQSRFHDHVIRNNSSLQNIKTYIINNRQTWKEDKYFIK